jgi:Flp pilus assembly protein CpaB
VNRTRLFLLGSVTLTLGSLVCFMIYNNLQTRSGARKEPMIGADLPPIIPPGMRAVSVCVKKVVAVTDLVFPGTRLDVLLATTVLENVAVIAVDRQRHCTPVITLLLSPDDAQKLTGAKGRIQLVSRNLVDIRGLTVSVECRGIPIIIDPPMHAPLGNATLLVYR